MGYMASTEVFRQAIAWCAKCKCAKPRPEWYPTRLIDINSLKTRIQQVDANTILTGGEEEWIRIVQKGARNFPRTEKQEAARYEEEEEKDRASCLNYRYVTLSHSWGSHENQPLALRESNSGTLLSNRGIRLGELPKTYREAILFAARIQNVGWIWIDSLCIIQNDGDVDNMDWRHESSDMQRVYRESFLNISATVSFHSGEGLYREDLPDSERVPRILWEDEINVKVDGIYDLESHDAVESVQTAIAGPTIKASRGLQRLPSLVVSAYRRVRPTSRPDQARVVRTKHSPEAGDNEEPKEAGLPLTKKGIQRCILIDVFYWDDIVNNAPVNVRAWVLQERLLAPRVLHFSKGQIAWECKEFEDSEGHPEGMPKYTLIDNRILKKPLYKGLTVKDGKELRATKLQGKLDPCTHLIGHGL